MEKTSALPFVQISIASGSKLQEKTQKPNIKSVFAMGVNRRILFEKNWSIYIAQQQLD